MCGGGGGGAKWPHNPRHLGLLSRGPHVGGTGCLEGPSGGGGGAGGTVVCGCDSPALPFVFWDEGMPCALRTRTPPAIQCRGDALGSWDGVCQMGSRSRTHCKVATCAGASGPTAEAHHQMTCRPPSLFLSEVLLTGSGPSSTQKGLCTFTHHRSRNHWTARPNQQSWVARRSATAMDWGHLTDRQLAVAQIPRGSCVPPPLALPPGTEHTLGNANPNPPTPTPTPTHPHPVPLFFYLLMLGPLTSG